MKYVQRIEDSRMWKDQFEDSMKGKGKMQGAYYVVNQGGKGENVGFIPPVAQDIVMAKTKIRGYKKRRKTVKKQIRRKPRRRKKVKKRAPAKKRKIRRKRKTKRKR